MPSKHPATNTNPAPFSFQRKFDFLKLATQTSYGDIKDDIHNIIKRHDTTSLFHLAKDFVGSSAWITNSLISIFKKSTANTPNFPPSARHNEIIDHIARNIPLHHSFKNSEIFYSIYVECLLKHTIQGYSSSIRCPVIFPTIVLVSGVLNEIYKTAAFERGVRNISKINNLKYIVASTHGLKSAKHNAKLIRDQLFEYSKDHPDEKLWLLAYSKGGLDCLYFLKRHPEWSKKNIVGLSTIASPLLGSQHIDSTIFQMINKIHLYENNRLYKSIDKKIDILAKEFQQSLNSRHQTHWFQKNFHLFPKNLFYSALALEANWYESHIYMILAKIFFPSGSSNDGVVDAKSAQFPSYFNSINLGVIKGHHLIGARSSSFAQEALIEAHIIFLKYFNYV